MTVDAEYRRRLRKYADASTMSYSGADYTAVVFLPMDQESLQEQIVKIDELINLGFVDALRVKHNESGLYTWWSQRGRARENNVGWRIDYHFVSDNLVGKIYDSYIQPQVAGSDHCPVVLELKNF